MRGKILSKEMDKFLGIEVIFSQKIKVFWLRRTEVRKNLSELDCHQFNGNLRKISQGLMKKVENMLEVRILLKKDRYILVVYLESNELNAHN